jgi:DNA-binding NtrC family response regulator
MTSPSLPMKFLLVDDHVLIREALRAVVRELDADAAILEASRWGEASRLLKEHSDVTLVLLDPGLPDREGLAALAEARMRHPKVPVVVLSGNSDCNEVERALGLGAVGFIPKSGERDVMLSALRRRRLHTAGNPHASRGGGADCPPQRRAGADLAGRSRPDRAPGRCAQPHAAWHDQ